MQRARTITFGLAALTAGYLYAFPSATIPYLAIVLGHIVAGFILAGLLIATRPRSAGWIVTAVGALLGIVLTWTGASRPFAGLLYAHIGITVLGLILLLAIRTRRPVLSFAVFSLAAFAVSAAAWGIREVRWRDAYRIQNPEMPPDSQASEG